MKNKTYTTYINFEMNDIETPFDFDIENVELEVTYTTYPAEEDLSIDKINIIKIDNFEPTNEQSEIIASLIAGYEEELKEMINDEIRIQQLSDKQAYAEWIYESKNF
jgi:hypothetical protein